MRKYVLEIGVRRDGSVRIENHDHVGFSSLVRELSLRNLSAAARISRDGSLSVTAEQAPGCEFACYLYEQGKVLAQQWYQSEPHFTFKELDGDPSSYRLVVFVKPIGAPSAQRTINVQPVADS